MNYFSVHLEKNYITFLLYEFFNSAEAFIIILLLNMINYLSPYIFLK